MDATGKLEIDFTANMVWPQGWFKRLSRDIKKRRRRRRL